MTRLNEERVAVGYDCRDGDDERFYVQTEDNTGEVQRLFNSYKADPLSEHLLLRSFYHGFDSFNEPVGICHTPEEAHEILGNMARERAKKLADKLKLTLVDRIEAELLKEEGGE